jgi:ribonucleoside-diphosphate reductase alpha chain
MDMNNKERDMSKIETVTRETSEYFEGDDLATNVFITKYALRDKDGAFHEKNPNDMHIRLASEFGRIEDKFGGNNQLSREIIFDSIKGFKKIVPQGSPMYGIGNNFVNVSLSNCVVVESPEDNISSIVDSGKDLANLFKRRCGVGLDISQLRPEGAAVSNSAGTTTGAWSFADFYSYICRMVGQNGRRGALMITMDVRHPDIQQFIKMKHDLTKVTGANVSVKISDDFMQAVEKDEKFTLTYPVGSKNPKISKEVCALDVWDQIVESATSTAEPGILMWDNITKNLPAHEYPAYKTICTNPCAEIPLSAYDSCRLISVNLKNFVSNPFTDKATFNFDDFGTTVKQAMRLSDDLVELEIEKVTSIMNSCDTEDEKALWLKLRDAAANGRRTGLGTHGLADALACLKLRYDSDEAIKVIDKIYNTLKVEAYRESCNLAAERGPFPHFDWEIEKDNAYIQSLPQEIKDLIKKHGRRNISILTNAPTGSVSIMSQTSSGLEPVFRNFYTRRRKIGHNDTDTKADFVDEIGDRWQEYKVFHHNVKHWQEENEFHTGEMSEDIPDFFVESDQIDWLRRVEIQETIQRHIDHAISSTINLPAGTKPEVVGELYKEGWKRGLKGITVYVDGSRTGVLVTDTKEDEPEGFVQRDAAERPDLVECEIHRTTIKGEKWVVLTGLVEGKPYELFAGLSSKITLPNKYTHGTIVKHPRKTTRSIYDLVLGEGDDQLVISDIINIFDNPNNAIFTRMISLSLRHGANVKFVVEQMQKDQDTDFTSFNKVLSRVLKKYISDGETASDKTCPSCEAPGLIYQDGCVTCTQCGYAKCG